MGERIAAVFEASRRTYGSPRVHAELRAEGVRVGRKRVARLMREGGLTVARRRRRVPRTTDSRHDLPVAPNLLDRKFAADRPDTVWLADISYIPTGEGWLYLAAIKDMATREIVGWSMAVHLGAELARDALLMAIRRRQPPPGLIHHSDRGVRYASGPYRATLARHRLVQSMEPQGELPRQRTDGELLRLAQDRARPPRQLPNPGGGQASDLRVRGSLLQPPAPPFRPRLLDPGPGLRADGQGRVTHLTRASTPAGQAHQPT